MTILVGILCNDGVVVGADSAVTFGVGPNCRTIEQTCRKIDVIGDQVIIAGSGQVGLGQRFVEVVRKEWTAGKFSGVDPIGFMKKLSADGIKDFTDTGAPKGAYGALVAFTAKHKPQLAELAVGDFQPELKDKKIWYSSMGSGQPLADPFLGFIRSVFWKDEPPVVEGGIFAVTWTIKHAVELNTGGIKGPIDIAVLEAAGGGAWKARILDPAEVQEHLNSVDAATEHLRQFQRGSDEVEVPKVDSPRPA